MTNKYAQYSKSNKIRNRDAKTFRHCGRKVLFTREGAIKKMDEINQNQTVSTKQIAYQCHFCNGWHLKSKKTNRK